MNSIEQRNVIYSLGTSNRTPQEFLDLFEAHGIEVGIDIRSFPTSRYPHFAKASLQRILETKGVQYEYLGNELGGFRKGGYWAYPIWGPLLSKKGWNNLKKWGGERKRVFSAPKDFPGNATGAGFQKNWLKEDGRSSTSSKKIESGSPHPLPMPRLSPVRIATKKKGKFI